ncbi:hypothetical protein DNL40_09790 [Xylanimonas oleitrophica]|uniref:YdbS-like PH domain-containing protein n=1 Tax=Xylanimonas oleitrophica TaxID=2607479 RepID=A0A2W5WYN0_9MICO|nr:PH domain-containing protein [Xylanimonas oleitrophica]PZR52935.1 hypothetical protein DNL40_09790 [Xylanimonas oleitrophica]
MTDAVTESTSPPDAGTADVPWSRLSHRTIWVDLAQTLLALSPTALAVGVFGVDPTLDALWPLLGVAVVGVLGAVSNVLRWIFTRYRITPEYVERRSGVFVRRYRSVRRDRIRSVDITARLRHRVAGLRVVLVGAGQQLVSGESALRLDAVVKADAEALRRELLATSEVAAVSAEEVADDGDGAAADGAADGGAAAGAAGTGHTEVLARFRPWWVVYNVVSVWMFFSAAGLLWGAYWLVRTFGYDPMPWVGDLLDPDVRGLPASVAIAVLLTGAIGAVVMAVNFFTVNWGYELARVPGQKTTQLRTRHGLFTTREVNRDERRLRGVYLSEPLLWRWMGMADTQVITTGLSAFSPSQPAAILPRGPVSVARPVAAAVLGADPDPLGAPLARHPRGALRRRLWWATWVAAVVTVTLGWLSFNDILPATLIWCGAGVWLVGLVLAVAAYRALGHAVVDDYLVVRSGATSRATVVLRRDSVSTIALRESILQRRLGLRSVTAMTAAGWGAYQAPDIGREDALAFAVEAAPGLLDPFVERVPASPGQPLGGD